jgi:DNA polymerase-4
MKKPDGLFLIPPEKAVEFVEKLPVERFFGVGKVTARKMHDLGIRNGYDLKQWSETDLIRIFGKTGKYYYQISRANDDREVNPRRIRKSLGAENTFAKDLQDMNAVKSELDKILGILIKRMKRTKTSGKTLTVKIKYSDFQQITRSHTISDWISGEKEIKEIYLALLDGIEIREGIRLLGLTLSHLNHEIENREKGTNDGQLTLDL